MWWHRQQKGRMWLCCVCAQRSVQTRKGRIPSCMCYFILNTFPVVIFGLFSDIEKLVVLPTCHMKCKIYVLLSCTLKTELHKLNKSQPSILATQSNLIFIVLCCFLFTTTEQIASSFLRRQALSRTPSWSHVHTVLLVFLSDFPIRLRAPWKLMQYPAHLCILSM